MNQTAESALPLQGNALPGQSSGGADGPAQPAALPDELIQAFSLPPMRDDLDIHEGPSNNDGAPTWALHDPVRNQFFRIGWSEYEIIRRWPMGNGLAIVADINKHTTLSITPEQLLAVKEFLAQNQLLLVHSEEAMERIVATRKGEQKSRLSWLLHHYLFFRVPLVKPDRFLSATLPFVQFVYSRRFFTGLFILAAFSLYLVARQWDTFTSTFTYFFSLKGMLLYGLALFFTKIIHELGHAYTCKRYGLKVPVMGVAFMVMTPFLYTDTSESWKLKDKKQRMTIGVAGMAAELIVAVIATLMWSFVDDGPLRSALFFIATVSWVMTLTINASPFMRWDGYYIFSDWLGIHNLQDRAFRMARWWMREKLFALGEPPPENLPPHTLRTMLLYAYGTWIYRFFLFLGIAVLVYHLAFKLLGIFLMAVELVWFIGRPIWNELKEWWSRREQMKWNTNVLVSSTLLLLAVGAMVIPWRTAVKLPATMKPEVFTRIYAPAPARIEEVLVEEGQKVQSGDVLLKLVAPDLQRDIKETALELETLQAKLSASAASAEWRQEQQSTREQLARATARLNGLREKLGKLWVVAPFAGEVTDVMRGLRQGLWVADDQSLMSLVQRKGAVVDAYATEDKIARLIDEQESGVFYPDSPELPAVPVVMLGKDPVNTKVLRDAGLASVYGGDIAVTQDMHRGLIPHESVYRVKLKPREPMDIGQVINGHAVLNGEAESFLHRAWVAVQGVFIRESGF